MMINPPTAMKRIIPTAKSTGSVLFATMYRYERNQEKKVPYPRIHRVPVRGILFLECMF
jgi:hypothetical protein